MGLTWNVGTNFWPALVAGFASLVTGTAVARAEGDAPQGPVQNRFDRLIWKIAEHIAAKADAGFTVILHGRPFV